MSAEGRLRTSFHNAMEDAKAEGFTSSFSLFDVLWLILAVGSAFSIGNGARAART